MSSLKEVVFGMVARKELSAAQAMALVKQLGAAWQPAMRSEHPEPVAADPTRPWPSVAIIGMAGRFPGAPDVHHFWQLLRDGQSTIIEAPPERWDAKSLYDPDPRQPGKTTCKWSGFLEGFADFDARFFNIPPREAEVMDPQQRLFLESAWLALEDAGYGDQALSNRRCGVFVGVGSGDFTQRLMASGLDPDGLAFSGNSNAILSARIAYLLNLKGPCLAVDTACSSSLTAIHLACESLAQGSSEMALAGGVCILSTASFYLAAGKTGMLSPRGQCRAFDQGADGFVPGEAAGALVLKPLVAALRDGDHIYGVIEGSAINQDGKTNGITAPSAPSQTALEQEVYRRFAIDPASIGYVEAHGTGTPLGDPIEVEALTRAFRAFTTERQFCALGSVKTNIGHTMSAAGVVSVIKTLLALQHRQLPPSLHFERENPVIGFADTPFFVNTELCPWQPRPGCDRLRAAVSAFGFSGTNVHLVIGEAPSAAQSWSNHPGASRHPSLSKEGSWRFFPLSARTGTALLQRAADLEQWLKEQPEPLNLDDLAFTLSAGRCHFEERLALVANDRDGLLTQLAQWRREGRMESAVSSDDPERTRLLELAQAYLQGQTPDWSTLYPSGQRQRLSLPGYPFERQRFLPGEQTHPRRTEGLHPLLDGVAPGEGALRFSSRFTTELPFLRDHQVNGTAILPGVCYLEMACAAARASRPGTVVRGLAKIAFTRPLLVADEPVTAVLNLEADGETLRFTVQSGSAAAPPHCRGELRLGEAVDAAVPRLDLAEVRRRATRQFDRTALYALFTRAGVVCGPYCQGVGELWLGENEALAELRLPPGEASALRHYTLHPTLLDGAFQTAMAWLAAQPGRADQVLVPCTVAEVEILGPLDASAFAYVQCRDAASARFDIALLDEEGRLRVRLMDFQAMPLNAAIPLIQGGSNHPGAERHPSLSKEGKPETPISLIQGGSNHPGAERHPSLSKEGKPETPSPLAGEDVGGEERLIPCYRPIWREEPLPTTAPTLPEGIALVVHPRGESALSERLAQALAPRIVLRVVLGDSDQSLAPGVFEIDRRQPEAWRRLCATLKPVAAVYFHTTVAESADPLDLATVAEAEQSSSLSLLRLAQALRHTGRGQPGMALTVITEDTQFVIAEDVVRPLTADVPGLTQTLSRECRDWRVSLVDVHRRDLATEFPSLDKEGWFDALLNEPGTEPGLAVAWRNSVRYCRYLEPVLLPEATRSAFREQGVYVVAGGGGGLGLTVARHLAATYRARVLLLGRSALDADRQRELAELANLGGEVRYQICDITDPAAVQTALLDARQRWGAVHGVIQAAMVLRDRALDHLDEDSFRAVLAPKVQGSVALARACIGQSLDFLAFFSSANAFVGNVGQGNYAAASTFQDAFAHFLRQRGEWPVYLLNWGFWGEVGAVADPFHIRQAARLGIGAIGRDEGIAVLERTLAGAPGQWLPMKASPATLANLGLRCYEPLPLADGDAEFTVLAEQLREAATPNSETESIAAAFTQVEAYGRARLVRVWREQGLLTVGQRFTAETLAQSLKVTAAHTRLLDALLALLADDGWLIRDEQGWRGSDRLAADTMQSMVELSFVAPWTAPFLGVLEHCLRDYPRLLCGELAATEVLFGPDTLPLVQALYRDNPIVAQ
ncbi:MAG: Carrier protein, partial [Pseudomonadota bacterium]|nr:Carrier protein [Pseudomonadota bacterium]